MAFKMKGFPLHSGTSPAKQYKSDAQRKAIYASKAERSAAKQKSADLKTLDELIEEGFTPADARRMQKDKAVTGVEKETDKQKMQRLEDEAAKANKAGDKEKAKKLMAQVSKLEDKIQGTTKPPTKQRAEIKKMAEMPQMLIKNIEEQVPTIIAVPPKEIAMEMQQMIKKSEERAPSVKGPGRRSKVGKKLTKVANIFRKKGNKRSPDFK
tara:strand:+ start:133 stop:762 length:630 start_codon:yes stop_codon:yes gene_type:complete